MSKYVILVLLICLAYGKGRSIKTKIETTSVCRVCRFEVQMRKDVPLRQGLKQPGRGEVRHGLVWFGVVWYGLEWLAMDWPGAIRSSKTRRGEDW